MKKAVIVLIIALSMFMMAIPVVYCTEVSPPPPVIEIVWKNYNSRYHIERGFSFNVDITALPNYSDSNEEENATLLAKINVGITTLESIFTNTAYTKVKTATSINFFKKYDSMTDVYIDNGITGYEVPESDENSVTTKSLFKSTTVNTIQSPFSMKTDVNTIIDSFVEYLFTNDVLTDYNQVRLVYGYATHYGDKTLSSNANKIKFVNMTNYHEFYTVYGDTPSDVLITISSPNQIGYYIVALILSFLAIIPCVVYIVKRKTRRNK